MEFRYLSRIMHEKFRQIPYLWACCSDLAMNGFWFMFYFPNRNDRQIIFYFQFEKKFYFLFVYVLNMHDDRVCLPGIMENKVNCHGKVVEFYYQISVGTMEMSHESALLYHSRRQSCQNFHTFASLQIILECFTYNNIRTIKRSWSLAFSGNFIFSNLTVFWWDTIGPFYLEATPEEVKLKDPSHGVNV